MSLSMRALVRHHSQVDSAGFKTRSILCMPIRNAQGTVIGVAQFVNKLDGTAFNKNDENLFEVHVFYCSLRVWMLVCY